MSVLYLSRAGFAFPCLYAAARCVVLLGEPLVFGGKARVEQWGVAAAASRIPNNLVANPSCAADTYPAPLYILARGVNTIPYHYPAPILVLYYKRSAASNIYEHNDMYSIYRSTAIWPTERDETYIANRLLASMTP
eukprot:6179160-Pleurochrysis_carterae.AAC.3